MYSTNNSASKPVQLFFSPQHKTSEPTFKKREEEFILDCTNSQQSKLPQYHQDQDRYSKSYLTLLFSRLHSQKQNRSPRGSHQTNNEDKVVSRQKFRQYLSNKINMISKTKDCQEVRSYLSPLNQENHSPKKALYNKSSVFLEHKFRCFRKKKVCGPYAQN